MTWLPDSTLSHLREIADWPDFAGTKYEILERIGQGGMASVYVAQDRDLDRRVAVKVIHMAVGDPAIQERMLAEARIIARLEHPGILPIHDLGFLPDGRIYYVMKLVRGRRLDNFIEQTASLPDRLRIFLRICDAVAFAHAKGVIHRDLKPSNIMIGDFGEVLVLDWGLAKLLGRNPDGGIPVNRNAVRSEKVVAARHTLHGTVLGTPGHMAPEQELGESDSIDERTDVYGLGVLLGLLLPHGAAKSIQAASNKAKSVNPDDRYSTVNELAQDVNSYLAGERVTAFPEGPLAAGRRLVGRHRTFVLLIATYLAIRVALLLITR
jgi:serine/threonine protein kinase